jgi:hypothetical protein
MHGATIKITGRRFNVLVYYTMRGNRTDVSEKVLPPSSGTPNWVQLYADLLTVATIVSHVTHN